MTVLRSQLPRKPQSSPEWRQALQLLARNPRGTIEDVLELGHGFSRETLATRVLNGLAMVMTETLSLGGATIKIERYAYHGCRSTGDPRLIVVLLPWKELAEALCKLTSSG